MRTVKEKASITLDGDLLEAIKNLAEKEDRSLSSYINLVLRQYVPDKDLWIIVDEK